tara:strand:- start:28 stop:282 length:255 start_codon:yes stop_codon:yes gene_type:complete
MKDEDKTFENEVIHLFDYKKELYAMQKYKSEAIMLENQLKGTKAIVMDFAKVIKELKEHNLTQAKEIDRLNEYVKILKIEKKTN